jgi:kinesin family protein 5
MSTLRFGIRAKAIQNNARVNAELPPSELKTLLKKAQSDILVLENYSNSLIQELIKWRSGSVPPDNEWVKLHPSSYTENGCILSKSQENTLTEDERDDFIRRENEFFDQLAEKDNSISELQKDIDSLRESAARLKQVSQQI